MTDKKTAQGWTPRTWASLAGAVAGVAGALLAEHHLAPVAARALGIDEGQTESGEGLPARYNYAIGLATAAGGILAWAAGKRVTVDAPTAGILLAAMCAAGVPDFLTHRRDEQAAREAEERERAAERERLARELSEAQARAADLTRQCRLVLDDREKLIHTLHVATIAGSDRQWGQGEELLSSLHYTIRELQRESDVVAMQLGQLRSYLADPLAQVAGNGDPA